MIPLPSDESFCPSPDADEVTICISLDTEDEAYDARSDLGSDLCSYASTSPTPSGSSRPSSFSSAPPTLEFSVDDCDCECNCQDDDDDGCCHAQYIYIMPGSPFYEPPSRTLKAIPPRLPDHGTPYFFAADSLAPVFPLPASIEPCLIGLVQDGFKQHFPETEFTFDEELMRCIDGDVLFTPRQAFEDMLWASIDPECSEWCRPSQYLPVDVIDGEDAPVTSSAGNASSHTS